MPTNKDQTEKDPIEKRLDCLILLSCMDKDMSQKEKLKIASNCLGISETAKLLNKDPSNFSKYINEKWIKKSKEKYLGVESNAKEE